MKLNTIKTSDDSFLIRLREKLDHISPDLIVLFGSYVLNNNIANDIDLLIISDLFQDIYYQYRRTLLPKSIDGKIIDPFCFTEKEFRSIFTRDHLLIASMSEKYEDIYGEFEKYVSQL